MRGLRRRISRLIFSSIRKNKGCYVSLGSEPPPTTFPQYIRAHSRSENNDESVIAPDGCFSVYVGKEKKMFFLPTAYLNHPLIRALLERAAEEFGINQAGVLTIPCDVKRFQHVLWLVHSDPNGSDINTEDIAKHYYSLCGSYVVEDAADSHG